MNLTEKKQLDKEVEKARGAISFEMDKLQASIDRIALKNVEFEKVDINQPPF